MKRILSAFLALAVSATLVFVVTSWKHGDTPVHAQGGCSVATLKGPYAFKDPGFVAPGRSVNGATVFPFAAMGVEAFDGAGNVSVSYTLVTNGAISTGLTGSGTYTVNSDCAGSVSFTTGGAAGLPSTLPSSAAGQKLLAFTRVPGSLVPWMPRSSRNTVTL